MTSRPIRRVLVANRGEIALRIIRACHDEGLEAVAVYSDADRHAPFVRAADVAVRLGPAPAAASYLNAALILDAAQSSGADAIHPGYGFFSERAPFARAVEEAGLVWVGPPSTAIEAMGDKTAARRLMQAAGVPIVPGAVAALDNPADALAMAEQIGYPVLVKAAAGGGGKGMRVVTAEAALPGALTSAASEALKAFGDGSVYLEKYVERPRHVEIQVLADHVRTVHVGERECSVQRRHQKLLEEAPSVAVTPALRDAMGAAAVAAAAAVGYRGAGTCEFLLAADGSFYFLEMNTRIQVEHPVTEGSTASTSCANSFGLRAACRCRCRRVRWCRAAGPLNAASPPRIRPTSCCRALAGSAGCGRHPARACGGRAASRPGVRSRCTTTRCSRS
jgi:acetyl/propionyl-CoA carboxylase alpha subunit